MKSQNPLQLRLGPRAETADWPPGESLFVALRRQGWLIGSACRGEGICGRCGLQVVDPTGALGPIGEQEARILAANRVPEGWRLSCLLLRPAELPEEAIIQVDSPAW